VAKHLTLDFNQMRRADDLREGIQTCGTVCCMANMDIQCNSKYVAEVLRPEAEHIYFHKIA
jgi:hypothetical protein